MTVSELCSLLRNIEYQEVIICDRTSVDDIVFKDSAYNAILSDFADCKVFNYELMAYNYAPMLVIYIY